MVDIKPLDMPIPSPTVSGSGPLPLSAFQNGLPYLGIPSPRHEKTNENTTLAGRVDDNHASLYKIFDPGRHVHGD